MRRALCHNQRMNGFLVVLSVGLFAALAYVLARRSRRGVLRGATPSASLRLSGPKSAEVSKAEPSTRTMVDVTPRGTSIKV
jgi:hypothetical protein